ncbi:cobalamin-binding protein [Candidatus Poribacteria bacterium]|nr:cobalamin-binding protein [Candidatus Poribacteria bacterium]
MKFIFRAALCLLLSHVGAGAASAESAVSYPLSIEDDMGRVVSFPASPARVVSVGPSTTEMLFAIGVADRLVGIDRFSNYPPETEDVEKVGGLVDPSIERIVGLRPDVVFMRDLSVQHVERLDALGLRTVVVGSRDVAGVYGSLKLLGWIMDAREEAEAVAAVMRDRLARIARVVEDVPVESRPSVFYELGHEPLYTAGPGSFVHEAIALAGGVNAAADVPSAWSSFSVESLLSRDPDIILVTVEESLDAIREGRRAGWRALRAVKTGRVYLIDGDAMNRPGPRLADAVDSLARLLYPDLFPEEEDHHAGADARE